MKSMLWGDPNMRKVFSSIEISETVLVRDALLHKGFDATIQNSASGGSAVPGFRPPAEVWIADADDHARARAVVVETLATLDSTAEKPAWKCVHCGEENPHPFELCWNCARPRDMAAQPG